MTQINTLFFVFEVFYRYCCGNILWLSHLSDRPGFESEPAWRRFSALTSYLSGNSISLDVVILCGFDSNFPANYYFPRAENAA